MSPYLFLLIVDVLQQLIKRDGHIKHPFADALSCPVLQYADDTLILLKADGVGLAALREVLDNFFAASGLHINYAKSTMVPMHVPGPDVKHLQGVLGCQVGGFPETYLVLPLSADKLRLSAFSPLIAKSDRCLSGWRTSLLSRMGRAVLINSVMDSQLTYAMSVLQLPAGTLDALDRRQRSFLWAGDDSVSGVQCLGA